MNKIKEFDPLMINIILRSLIGDFYMNKKSASSWPHPICRVLYACKDGMVGVNTRTKTPKPYCCSSYTLLINYDYLLKYNIALN